MRIRYKGKLYDAIAKDRSMFFTDSGNFIMADNNGRTISGLNNWLDLTSSPFAIKKDLPIVDAKNIVLVQPIEIPIETQQMYAKTLESTKLFDRQHIVGTRDYVTAQKNSESDDYISESEYYADLLMEGPFEVLTGKITSRDAARLIIYSQEVQQLYVGGMTLRDAIFTHLKNIGYITGIYPGQIDILVNGSNSTLSIQSSSEGMFSYDDEVLSLIHPDFLSLNIGKPNEIVYDWGNKGTTASGNLRGFDASSLIADTVKNMVTDFAYERMSINYLVGEYRTRLGHYKIREFSNLPVGAIVISRGNNSTSDRMTYGHIGMVVGYGKYFEPVIAHCCRGGMGWRIPGNGVVYTSAKVWNRYWTIDYVVEMPGVGTYLRSGENYNLYYTNRMIERGYVKEEVEDNTNDGIEMVRVRSVGQIKISSNKRGKVVYKDLKGNIIGYKNTNVIVNARNKRETVHDIIGDVLGNIKISSSTTADAVRALAVSGGSSSTGASSSNDNLTTTDMIEVISLSPYKALNDPVKNKLNQDINEFVDSNTAAYETVAQQTQRQADFIPKKSTPSNMDGLFNYYPVFNGVITHAEKKFSTKGYTVVLTVRSKETFLNKTKNVSGESNPSSTYMDFKKIPHEMIPEFLSNCGIIDNKIGNVQDATNTGNPTLTVAPKTASIIIGASTEVYRGIFEPWEEWKDTDKTGWGGYPMAFDGLSYREMIEALAAVVNFEAYFDEEGIFWFRPPQFDTNPFIGSKEWIDIKNSPEVKGLNIKVNWEKAFSGCYVSGSPTIVNGGSGSQYDAVKNDKPYRIEFYAKNKAIKNWLKKDAPMIRPVIGGSGAGFADKYVTSTKTAKYYAQSCLDRANGEFATGVLTFFPRPDLVAGRTIFVKYMGLVVYPVRIINSFVANNMEMTYTDINFAYPRQFKDKLAFNNYGHQDRTPEKGMSIMSFPDNHTPVDNDLIPPSATIIPDMQGGVRQPDSVDDNKFGF